MDVPSMSGMMSLRPYCSRKKANFLIQGLKSLDSVSISGGIGSSLLIYDIPLPGLSPSALLPWCCVPLSSGPLLLIGYLVRTWRSVITIAVCPIGRRMRMAHSSFSASSFLGIVQNIRIPIVGTSLTSAGWLSLPANGRKREFP